MLRAILTVKNPRLMLHISRAFIESIEFKNNEWQNVNSASIISGYESSPETDINLLIYILIRDHKLLELREKLE